MCTIDKYGLSYEQLTTNLVVIRRLRNFKKTDLKHMSKLANNWQEKKSKELTGRQCLPTWLRLRTFRQIFKIKITKKQFYKLSIFALDNKATMEIFTRGIGHIRLVNRIYEVLLESDGDFILPY